MTCKNYPEGNFNLPQLFLDRARRYGHRAALLRKLPGKKIASLSWHDWEERVRETALGLYACGVRKGQSVAILSENRPEWTFADLGILSLGAVTVPIYANSTAEEVGYILDHAGIEVLFLSSIEQFQKIKSYLAGKALLKRCILFDSPENLPARVISLQACWTMGRDESLNNHEFYRELVDAVSPDDLATMIYTSGTTGSPKGVMLTHRNFVLNACYASERVPVNDEDIVLSFLPLSHVFERLAGYYFLILNGATIAYAENMQTIPEDLLVFRPTMATAVPRFYEKMHARIYEKVRQTGSFKQGLFEWAIRIGRKMARRHLRKAKFSFWVRCKFFFAKKIVLNQIKKKLGGRVRFFISGGGPLPKELAEFFWAADVLILEGYGLTETSPVICANSPEDFRFGAVGKPLPHVEVKIAEDGEILTRSACLMKGYYGHEEATHAMIRNGWLHTGDIGVLDEDGFLKITDRKKDIIVTSGGKNISPQNIENLLQVDILFKQVVVLGDKRNYLVALIVPDRSEVERFACESGILSSTWEELLRRQEVYRWVEEKMRGRMRALPPHEQIKYFSLLAGELTHAAGELTPTLKIRRKIVCEKYGKLIEELYARGAEKIKGADQAPYGEKSMLNRSGAR